MEILQPFSSIAEHNQLTQNEYIKLKMKLAGLKAEFAQKTGVNHPSIDLKNLQKIEQEMCSIEHILAHSEVIYEEPPIPNTAATVRSYFTEFRFTLMGMRLKVMHKINPKKYALTQHSVTYHLKR